MITWMQKHNKYLVWTIWVATIAFIGAGFVGWGSYKYGSKASAIGKAGDVEISNAKLNFTYQNLYERYNEMFKGKFDEAQAKKMGLIKQAFDSLASQAQLLNLAQKYGIVVSEKELADYIAGMRGFQENGVFSQTVYKTYLKNRRIKSPTFESILRDELIVQKLMSLLTYPAVSYETQTIASALSVEDKIAYKVLSAQPEAIQLGEEDLRKAWQENKDAYLTPRMYELAVLWTDTKDVNVTEADIREYYDKNSFNYAEADGTIKSFEQAKADAARDLKIVKGKKQALLDYIAFKKGKKSAAQTQKLPIKDPRLTAKLWDKILQSDAGTILKPQPVGSRYATVKIVRVVEPEPMSFEQAKPAVEAQLRTLKATEALEAESKKLLETIDTAELTTSDYLRLTQHEALPPLNVSESLQFLQKLFTSSGKKGIISLSKHVVVYRVVDQRIGTVDANLTLGVQNETDQIKKRVFEEALFKKLNELYPVKAYAKGL